MGFRTIDFMTELILKGHNQNALDKLEKGYKAGIRTQIYTSGVGTGKTYVFMGLLKYYFTEGKIIYVLPKYAIEENIREYEEFEEFKDRVEFVTNQSFSNVEKGMSVIEGASLVCIDECHHLGSDVYGKTLLTCMERSNIPFLGITATPKREDGINVVDYFEGYIDGITTSEAMACGLMPGFDYHLGHPEYDLKEVEDESAQAVRAKISYVDSEEKITEICHKHTKNKWLVFVSSIAAIKENEAMIRRIFDGYKVLILHSQLDNLKEVLDEYHTTEKVVIISCNMLLEGVHFKGTEAILLLRNIGSFLAFEQILGRVNHIGATEKPVVVDCSENGVILLDKLIYEGAWSRNNGSSKENALEKAKEVINIQIGDYEPWDGVEELLYRFSARYRKDVDARNEKERAKEAVRRYLDKRGVFCSSEAELKKHKSKYKLAIAVANTSHVSIPAFVTAMQEQMQKSEG